jgi:hypothetical protein
MKYILFSLLLSLVVLTASVSEAQHCYAQRRRNIADTSNSEYGFAWNQPSEETAIAVANANLEKLGSSSATEVTDKSFCDEVTNGHAHGAIIGLQTAGESGFYQVLVGFGDDPESSKEKPTQKCAEMAATIRNNPTQWGGRHDPECTVLFSW